MAGEGWHWGHSAPVVTRAAAARRVASGSLSSPRWPRSSAPRSVRPAMVARLWAAATCGETLRSSTAAWALTRSHSTGLEFSEAARAPASRSPRAAAGAAGAMAPARRAAAGGGGPGGALGAGRLPGRRREPFLPLRAEQVEQHCFAGFEVAEHVGLGQGDPADQLVQRDVGHRHLGQHGRRGVQDRAASHLTLLGTAGSLENGHESIITDRRSLV